MEHRSQKYQMYHIDWWIMSHPMSFSRKSRSSPIVLHQWFSHEWTYFNHAIRLCTWYSFFVASKTASRPPWERRDGCRDLHGCCGFADVPFRQQQGKPEHAGSFPTPFEHLRIANGSSDLEFPDRKALLGRFHSNEPYWLYMFIRSGSDFSRYYQGFILERSWSLSRTSWDNVGVVMRNSSTNQNGACKAYSCSYCLL